MKLLDEFKEQLNQLGDIKRVWLTSFNINIDFIESNILPAVLGMESPKSRMDYEAFQKELNDLSIDFRIFGDKRMMNRDDNKRTSIDVYGISPRLIDGFSKTSLFHPKVIYLEDKNGRAILGAGSANLTMSGWGKNQEVFAFRKVSDVEQSREIQHFFKNLLVNTGDERKLVLGKNYWGKEKWSFIHSFQESTFLKQLFSGYTNNELAIWSPYFPRNLAAYIGNLKECLNISDLKVAVVPDRMEGKYIRTEWNSEIQKLLDKGELSFYENPTLRHESTDLCHSKVWKTSSRLAIGSWNFTGPGSNALDKNENWLDTSNIEAGFIFNDKKNNVEDVLGAKILISKNDFASSDILDKDPLVVPDELPFEIHVCFDWKEQFYSISGTWIENEVDIRYKLKIPDVGEIDLIWKPRKKCLDIDNIPIDLPKEILVNHNFDVIYKDNVVYRGLIIEKDSNFRRVQSFDSLNELLDNLISTDNLETGGISKLRNEFQLDQELFENDSYSSTETTVSATSYFRLFQATDTFEMKIHNINKIDDLEKLLFVYPGCLQEFSEKVKAKILDSEPSVFNWFLSQEINELVRIAREQYSRIRMKGEATSPVEHKWAFLKLDIPSLPSELSNRKRYINLIKKECSYGVK